MTMRRRDALKTIGGLAGAAATAKFLPACGDDGNETTGITTYVYLMLENRSYDHMFGSRTRDEGKPGTAFPTGYAIPDAMGNMVEPYVPADPASECVLDPPHGWDAAHASFNNGAMDGFLREHQADHGGATREAMQYLMREHVPISYALADAYTSCDRWFCSVMGPTLPNRAYWHAATSLGLRANGDVLNELSDTGASVPTIYTRLDEAGVDWAYYFGNLAVVAFLEKGTYGVDLGPNDGTGRVRRFGDPSLGGSGQFFEDAAAGRLPSVVYIDPMFGVNDDHPPVHPILAQQLIGSIYNALARSPQWKNILFVVTYDENGGFFDHVPPPTTTDDTEATFGVPGFEQMGFRVPALVMGPYVKKGHVSSVVYDHTSALKHLQVAFNLEPLNARMDAANDLSDCIDQDRLARGEWEPPVEIPEVDPLQFPISDPRCVGSGGLKSIDPISQWVDANPGKLKPEYDLRPRKGS